MSDASKQDRTATKAIQAYATTLEARAYELRTTAREAEPGEAASMRREADRCDTTARALRAHLRDALAAHAGAEEFGRALADRDAEIVRLTRLLEAERQAHIQAATRHADAEQRATEWRKAAHDQQNARQQQAAAHREVVPHAAALLLALGVNMDEFIAALRDRP